MSSVLFSIEAIGGCRESHQTLDYYRRHDSSHVSTSTKHSKTITFTEQEEMEQLASKKTTSQDEMFTFENESDELLHKHSANDTSSDNDVENIETNSNDGNLSPSLFLKGYILYIFNGQFFVFRPTVESF